MSYLEHCKKHGEDVLVVFQTWESKDRCPLCKVEEELKELKQEIAKNLEGEPHFIQTIKESE